VWAGGTKVGDIRSACHDECANGMHLWIIPIFMITIK
jgi:hypothetical protein